MRAVLDQLVDAVVVLDVDLRLTAVNAAASRLLGVPAAEAVGRLLPELLLPPGRDDLRRAWKVLPEHTGSWETVAGLTVEPGPPRQVRLLVGPLQPGGRLDGAVVTLRPVEAGPVLPAAPGVTDVAAELNDALLGDEILLHYQPIVRLSDRRPVAMEALVRWDHPRRGLLSPGQFLDAADTAALAPPLAQRVLGLACSAAAEWERLLGPDHPVTVSVNLSARQLLQPGTPALVADALRAADCPPERLLIEVSESTLIGDSDAGEQALRALKEIGITIAVDDLGTGSSALSYLGRFPIDLVKIDRSLVADLGSDAQQSAVLASLVSLAQAIGVECVAEGVETADQLGVLDRLGCNMAQGYLFSRAMTLATGTEWLVRALTPHVKGPAQDASINAQTLQRALALQAEGASLHTVAARLNAEGDRNAGRRWHHTAVAQLIAAHRFPDLDV